MLKGFDSLGEVNYTVRIMEGLIRGLKEVAVQAQALSKRLIAYQRFLTAPVDNAYEREKLLGEIEEKVKAFPPGELQERLLNWLNDERALVAQAIEEFRFEFGRKLFTALEGSGLVVKGQLPFLRIGFFSVRADFTTGRATIFWGPEIERLKSGVPLEPFALAKTVRGYQESLVKGGIREPERFLFNLWQAYQRVIRAKGLNDGERVFLVDLLGELVILMQSESFRVNPTRDNFKEYPRIRFSYDLYLLRSSSVRMVQGWQIKLSVANFDATGEKAKALWVPDTPEGEGTYYSYISFVPAERRNGGVYGEGTGTGNNQ